MGNNSSTFTKTGIIGLPDIYNPSTIHIESERLVTFKILPFFFDASKSLIAQRVEYFSNKERTETRFMYNYFAYVQIISDDCRSSLDGKVVLMKIPQTLVNIIKSNYSTPFDFFKVFSSPIIGMRITTKIINDETCISPQIFRDHSFTYSDKVGITIDSNYMDEDTPKATQVVNDFLYNNQTEHFLKLERHIETEEVKQHRENESKKENDFNLTFPSKTKDHVLELLKNDDSLKSNLRMLFVGEVSRVFESREIETGIRDLINEKLLGADRSMISEIHQLTERYFIFKSVKKDNVTFHTVDTKDRRVLIYNSETRIEQILVTLGFEADGVNAQSFAKYAMRMLNN